MRAPCARRPAADRDRYVESLECVDWKSDAGQQPRLRAGKLGRGGRATAWENAVSIALGDPGSRAGIAQLKTAIHNEICTVLAPGGTEIHREPVEIERAHGSHQPYRYDRVPGA